MFDGLYPILTRCSNWYRRTNGLNLSNVAVSTASLALGYDIPVACDTALHISVGATMSNLQVTGRCVACESQWLLYEPSNLTFQYFTVCSKRLSQWFLCLSERKTAIISAYNINPLKPELNPICYLLALLGAQHFLHVSRIRVKLLTFRRLISYIYGAPILDVSRSHTTTQHSR